MSDRNIPSRRRGFGASPTEDDEFFRKLDKAAKEFYGDRVEKPNYRNPSRDDGGGYDGEAD